MMLADEGFVVSQPVGQMDQSDIALERQRGILGRVMAGHHEQGKFHGIAPVASIGAILHLLSGKGYRMDAVCCVRQRGPG